MGAPDFADADVHIASSQHHGQPGPADKPHHAQPPRRRTRRIVLISAGALFALVGVAAGVTAVLCTTRTLQCSLQPFSIRAGGAAASQPGRARACPVQYAPTAAAREGGAVVDTAGGSNAAPPLLLGGVATSCKSGCQPRDSVWSESCKMDPESRSTWGLCEAAQRPALVALADRLSDGAAGRFSPCDLYALLRGRTLWLVGDSHMKSTYTAARCLMLDFWQHGQGECAAASGAERQLELHQAQLFAPRNLTLRDITEPRCIHLNGGGRICFLHTVRGEVLVSGDAQKPGVLEVLQRRGHAHPADVFYVSFGRWYTHSCQHLEDRAYNASLEALGSNYEATKAKWPHVIFGVPPFDHTTCDPKFDYKREKACPAAGNGTSIDMYQRISSYAHDLLAPHGLPIIDYQADTLPLTGAHLGTTRSFKSAIDCLHYCRPGLPEMDLWFVYNTMQQQGVQPVTSDTAQTKLPCTRVKPFM